MLYAIPMAISNMTGQHCGVCNTSVKSHSRQYKNPVLWCITQTSAQGYGWRLQRREQRRRRCLQRWYSGCLIHILEWAMPTATDLWRAAEAKGTQMGFWREDLATCGMQKNKKAYWIWLNEKITETIRIKEIDRISMEILMFSARDQKTQKLLKNGAKRKKR